MKRWIRIGTTMVATAAALALGLSSASAGPTGRPTPSAPPPATGSSATGSSAAGGHTPAFQANPSFRPPATAETLFYPVTPCRIVDTRHGGGILTNNVPRTFYVTGTFGFAPQGGKSRGCGIPAAATGITTNVTVAGSLGEGYLTGYPTGATPPLTNFITTHKDLTLTANPTFALGGSTKPLTITDHGKNTHVVVDVTGYYIPQIEGLVSNNGVPYSGTSRILSASRTSTGVYQVTVDSDVSFCTPVVTPYFGTGYYASAYAFDDDVVNVYTWTLDVNGKPVPSDGVGYFYLAVIC